MLKIRKWRSLGFACAAGVLLLSVVSSPALAEPARRSLDLELDEVPGNTGYEIRVIRVLADGTKKPPVMFNLKETHWSAKLSPGKYTMEVRTYDSRHVPGAWSSPEEFVIKLPAVEIVKPEKDFVFKSEEQKTEKVEFEWKPVEGAEKYKVQVLNSDGTVFQESVEKDTSMKVKLPVGHDYAWAVTPVMEGGIDGEAPAAPVKFELFGGKLSKPKVRTSDDVNTTEIDWAQSDFATSYKVTVETLRDGIWKPFDVKEVKANHRLYKNPVPSGKYRVTVVAKGDHREDSEEAEEEFKTTFINTRSPAAVEQVKSEGSYETKSVLFAMASYYVSFVNTSASNNDNGQPYSTSSSPVGGTGRVGLGTWFKEDSNIGLLGIADLSGYSFQNPQSGQNGTTLYYSGTLEGIYRMRLGALGQMRFNFGGQYRLLPVIVSSNPSTSVSQQSQIVTLGPVAGMTLLHGFTHKVGAQINFQVMDSTFGVSTPNGQSNIPTISYQAGLMGSLNLGPNLVGFVGYAFRDEVAQYTALAPAAGTPTNNKAEISGNYINLLLEYGF